MKIKLHLTIIVKSFPGLPRSVIKLFFFLEVGGGVDNSPLKLLTDIDKVRSIYVIQLTTSIAKYWLFCRYRIWCVLNYFYTNNFSMRTIDPLL